jgi:thiamine pyrophosphate-dependent acetolactate synthase large subunit-like protein
VRPGQKVLVHAGAGGLGSTVIQFAKHLGAYVATTARTRDLDPDSHPATPYPASRFPPTAGGPAASRPPGTGVSPCRH